MPGARRIRRSGSPSAAVASVSSRIASKPRRIWIRSCSRSEEHTSELQSLMRISYAVFCLKKKKKKQKTINKTTKINNDTKKQHKKSIRIHKYTNEKNNKQNNQMHPMKVHTK